MQAQLGAGGHHLVVGLDYSDLGDAVPASGVQLAAVRSQRVEARDVVDGGVQADGVVLGLPDEAEGEHGGLRAGAWSRRDPGRSSLRTP